MKLLILTILFRTEPSKPSYIDFIDKTIDKIEQVESNGNEKAIGDNGKALGSLQIWKILVDDFNRLFGSKFKHTDVLNRKTSKCIAKGMLSYGAQKFKTKFCRYPNEIELAMMWNFNIYNGYKKRNENYFKKLNQVK